MNFDHQIWDGWAQKLHRWGIDGFIASLLEAAGPLTVLGAQVVHILQPLIGRRTSGRGLDVLAEMLEEPEQVRLFVNYLREVQSQ